MTTLILLIGAPLLAAIISFFSKKAGTIAYVSGLAILISAAAALMLAPRVAASGTVAFSPLFAVDALGMIGLLITTIVGCAATFYSVSYLRREVKKEIIGFRRVRQYFVLLDLFLAAMILACAAANPIIMWLAIESTTLASAFLVSFYHKPSATEAAWKYLLINSLGLLLGFFGTLLYLGTTALSGEAFVTWHALLSSAAMLSPDIARIAFVFVLVGYGTKTGLAPMHTWLPDAHSKAPVPISALLSGVLLNVAFIAVLRYKAVTDLVVGRDFSQHLLIALGLLSIVIAAGIILIQKNYKRMLAYSSIENMGIMALGFGFGGVASLAALLHMIYHALTKSLLFLSAGNIFLAYSTTKIARVRGVLATLPVTGILFFAGILAISGLPPFGIFFTKLAILFAGSSAHPFAVAVALCAFAVIFIGFLRHTTDLLFSEPAADADLTPNIESDRLLLLVPGTLLALLVVLGFWIPSPLAALLAAASVNL